MKKIKIKNDIETSTNYQMLNMFDKFSQENINKLLGIINIKKINVRTLYPIVIYPQKVKMSYISNNGLNTIKGKVDGFDCQNRILKMRCNNKLTDKEFLKMATCLVATNRQFGVLWNAKTKEAYEVSLILKDYFIVCLNEILLNQMFARVMSIEYAVI